ncbi:hypothetical protein [Sphingomicrobium nitratireducens]|uniref:hypothetical protein n=1 Tax=Sphingomicrobium nitratireducens TaxID=2964666 RepID=UPI00223FBA53|nr:hypothetical protein [Sphingomicrobium nitratireducens]
MTRTRSFRPVIMAALVLVASLSCYLISLRVASERAALEGIEQKIAYVSRDIRTLETEIGTRGRLAQLERWNVRFLRLSAPRADQFVDSGFALAALAMPEKREAIEAPVVLASADRDEAADTLAGLVHTASMTTDSDEPVRRKAEIAVADPLAPLPAGATPAKRKAAPTGADKSAHPDTEAPSTP